MALNLQFSNNILTIEAKTTTNSNNSSSIITEIDSNHLIDLTPLLDPYILNNIQVGSQNINIQNDIDITEALDFAIEDYLNNNLNPKYLKVGDKIFNLTDNIEMLDITNPIINIIKDQEEEE